MGPGAQIRRLEKLRLAEEKAKRKSGRSKSLLREAWRSGNYRPEVPDVREALAAIDALWASVPSRRRPRHLEGYAQQILSQHGEDGITYELLKRVGMETRKCVELGSGSNGGNAGFMIAGLGYRGLLVDGDPDLAGIAQATFGELGTDVTSDWVTREGVDDLLASHGFEGEIDYLGIDLDGIDWWIWEALSIAQPRIVVVEYNAIFGPKVSATIAYHQDFSRKARMPDEEWVWPKGYFGASFTAFERLADRKGYRLVTGAPDSTNAYFIRKDLARGTPTRSVRSLYQPPRKESQQQHAKLIQKAGVIAWAQSVRKPLVEVAKDGTPELSQATTTSQSPLAAS